jgi:hypothetical protein
MFFSLLNKKLFVQSISVPQVIHGALHGAKLECIEEGDDLSSDCAVVLLEHEVSQLDQQQDGKGGHLAVDLGNRRHFALKQCLTKQKEKICVANCRSFTTRFVFCTCKENML